MVDLLYKNNTNFFATKNCFIYFLSKLWFDIINAKYVLLNIGTYIFILIINPFCYFSSTSGSLIECTHTSFHREVSTQNTYRPVLILVHIYTTFVFWNKWSKLLILLKVTYILPNSNRCVIRCITVYQLKEKCAITDEFWVANGIPQPYNSRFSCSQPGHTQYF